MPDALRHLLPTDPAQIQVAVVWAYVVASSAGSLAAGLTVGWVWGRR